LLVLRVRRKSAVRDVGAALQRVSELQMERRETKKVGWIAAAAAAAGAARSAC
jgi:hypothetical protein